MTRGASARQVGDRYGSGGGIGSAISRKFLSEGAAVVAVDRDAGALDRLATAVRGSGGVLSTLCADVAEESTAASAVARARDDFGRLDVLVPNAIHDLPLGPVTTMSLADWRLSMAVNLDAAFLLAKHAIPIMETGNGGSIILIASQLGGVARPGRPWYCAAKGALIALAKAMALDHAAHRIRVNSLSPGPVETARYLRNFPTLEAARASHHTLVGRLGAPDEIAAAPCLPGQRRVGVHDRRRSADRRRLHGCVRSVTCPAGRRDPAIMAR